MQNNGERAGEQNYHRTTEEELLEDYLKAIDLITMNEENVLKKKVEMLTIEKSRHDRIEIPVKLE
jgi:hypothetical protein